MGVQKNVPSIPNLKLNDGKIVILKAQTYLTQPTVSRAD